MEPVVKKKTQPDAFIDPTVELLIISAREDRKEQTEAFTDAIKGLRDEMVKGFNNQTRALVVVALVAILAMLALTGAQFGVRAWGVEFSSHSVTPVSTSEASETEP